jgi:hypothetical protein
VGLNAKFMWKVYLGEFMIVLTVSILWVRGIDKHTKFKNENPNHNDNEGWLDWDCDKAHTEHEL